MDASSSFISNESGAVQKENNSATLVLWKIFGKVLLAGIGFFIGCFLGLLVALYTGLIVFSVC